MATKKDLALENEKLKAQLAQTSKASASARQLAEDSVAEPVYPVRSIINVTISAQITDARGNPKHLMWPQKGAVHTLTASQIAEIQEHRDMFYDGFLVAPGLIEPSDNCIEDIDSFITGLAPDSVRERIGRFDRSDPLFAIYHHLENKRLDAANPNDVLTPKEQLVLHAVIQRLNVLVGFNFSTTDVE